MGYPYKRAVSEADRAIFEKWLRGIAVFYATVSLLVVCAIAISHTIGGHTQSDVAAINTSSPSLPPRTQ